MQLEEVLIHLVDANLSQHTTLLQRQDQITVKIGQKAATQKQAIENHYIEYSAKPISGLIEALCWASSAQSVIAGAYSTIPAPAPVHTNPHQV